MTTYRNWKGNPRRVPGAPAPRQTEERCATTESGRRHPAFQHRYERSEVQEELDRAVTHSGVAIITPEMAMRDAYRAKLAREAGIYPPHELEEPCPPARPWSCAGARAGPRRGETTTATWGIPGWPLGAESAGVS